MKKRLNLIIPIIIVLLSSCATTNQTSTEANNLSIIYTAAAMTAEQSSPYPLVFPTSTIESSLETEDYSPPPFTKAVINTSVANLRAGPSTFFEVIATYQKDTEVECHGMTQDGAWIFIVGPAGEESTRRGWIFATLLDMEPLDSSLGIISWPLEQTIFGFVTDQSNNPIYQVRVTATFEGEKGKLQSESTSALDGSFNIYLPDEMIGEFDVQIVAVNCSSNISVLTENGQCEVRDFLATKWRELIQIPLSDPVMLSYEKAVAHLFGKVIYQDGWGASRILVKATRIEDGVESEIVTPQGGEFSLPLGIGEWSVIAIRFDQDGTPIFGETRFFYIVETGQTLEDLVIPYTEIVKNQP